MGSSAFATNELFSLAELLGDETVGNYHIPANENIIGTYAEIASCVGIAPLRQAVGVPD